MNRIVAPPVALTAVPPPLSPFARTIELPLAPDTVTGWRPYHFFRGSTPNLTALNCHVSVLSEGRCPHDPHQHPEEEILIVLSGEADLVIPDAEGSVRIQRLTRGSFVYYPANQWHTIRTPPDHSATYLMFKWEGMETSFTEPLGTTIVDFSERFEGTAKIRAEPLLSQPLDIISRGRESSERT